MTPSISPLRRRMVEDMNTRKLAAGTQKGQLRACQRFTAFLKRSGPPGQKSGRCRSGAHGSSSFRCSLSAHARSRRSRHEPPLYALRATVALPSGVRGPVDFSQGRHCRISSACRARRSDVQPFATILLQ